jgi:hypothetical protein
MVLTSSVEDSSEWMLEVGISLSIKARADKIRDSRPSQSSLARNGFRDHISQIYNRVSLHTSTALRSEMRSE